MGGRYFFSKCKPIKKNFDSMHLEELTMSFAYILKTRLAFEGGKK